LIPTRVFLFIFRAGWLEPQHASLVLGVSHEQQIICGVA
jgi:hypothetical protein